MPEYTVYSGDIMIKFTGPEDRIIRVSDTVNDKVNEGVNVHVNGRQKELLSYLIQDPGYTVSQLSEIIKVSRKTIAGYLKVLKDKGIIERVVRQETVTGKLQTDFRFTVQIVDCKTN